MDRNHDDLAGRFLELASAWTPAGRRDWTRAMLAELDQITGTGARWRFAIGAAQVALIPPASGRLAAVVLAALATAAAAIIHVMLPGSGPLAAIAIPGLPALGGWFALARPHPSRQVSVIGGAVQVIAVAGVMACVVLLLRQSVLYPGQSGNSGAWIGQVMTVIFAAGPATYLLLILRRPGPLGSGRHSGLLGLIAASITGVVFLISQPPGGMSDNRAFHYAVWGAMVGAPIAAGLLAAIAARGRRADQWADQRARQWAGVAEMVWGWLLTGPAMFIVLLLTTSRGAIVAEARLPATIEEAHQQGATSITAWVAQDDLGGAMVIFTFLCFLAVMAFAVAYTMYRWGTPGEGSQASRSATNGPADT
jgi:hypothetical protein